MRQRSRLESGSHRLRPGAERRGSARDQQRLSRKLEHSLGSVSIEYPQSDSNRQHTDFKSVASANWAMGASPLATSQHRKRDTVKDIVFGDVGARYRVVCILAA